MMNNYALSSFVILALLVLPGNTVKSPPDIYTVIKVQGTITYIRSGLKMQRGDQFASNQKLKFNNSDSKAAVISKSKGRFVLTQKKTNSTKSNLIPAMSNISSRGATTNLSGANDSVNLSSAQNETQLSNSIDLQNYFTGNLLLLDSSSSIIQVKELPITDSSFFYVTYVHNGETIAKKLQHDDNRVIFERKSIFTIDGSPVEVPSHAPINLFYRDDAKNTSALISKFELILPNQNELLEELKIIQSQSDKSKFTRLARAHIKQFYGKFNYEELEFWLDANSLR